MVKIWRLSRETVFKYYWEEYSILRNDLKQYTEIVFGPTSQNYNNPNKFDEISVWLLENIQSDLVVTNRETFHFLDPKEAVQFKLTWG